ncbi:RELN-like protein [Mya arenaria]|uniref:Reelin n=1 Tax=Mya arenaria TaxID=6604 RepID=A0ABY7FXS4_MYAAR|nr:RELN-like protein [Mya arenaria]
MSRLKCFNPNNFTYTKFSNDFAMSNNCKKTDNNFFIHSRCRGDSLVFRQGSDKGEHSVVTRDLNVGPMSVLQFDNKKINTEFIKIINFREFFYMLINVGCSSESTHKYPVKLEYSPDGGKTWKLVVPNCADVSTAHCHDSVMQTSLHYGGTSKYWRRVVIPLDDLYVCGTLRFRWYQGVIPEDDYGPEWAIDNVFIGMACMQHCLGHGEDLVIKQLLYS